MSDLIIKPSGTNANFKVQNPSGTNKITMDSDGVTTIASNTTFSGTGNNIGTATAGTLGSGVTFPVGHVLQVQFGHLKDNFTTTTAGEWINTGLDVTITPSSTSNKIYIQACIAGVGNSAAGYNTRVSILQPFANSDSNVILSTMASNNNSSQYQDYNAQGPVPGGNGVYRTFTWGGFHSPSSTSALTYVVALIGEGSGTSRTHYFNQGHSSFACYCGITAWEVVG